MTVVNPKSISGINSITTGSGSDDLLTIHTNNGTERLRVDSTGATKIVTGIVTSLEATTGNITTLRAPTGIVTSLQATTGDITTLRAPTGIVTTFVTNTAKVGAAVTITESGIEASGIGITCANINGAQIGGRRNIVINGAMQIAQRGTSHSSGDGYAVDRFRLEVNGVDENPTLTQGDISSGTTPYTLGFRKSWKVQNGNQTGGVGATDRIMMQYKFESQDITNSGWNYTSASSFITLSFWVKSSVAQNFYGRLNTYDGSVYNYPIETGSLSADTWTKVTKTIAGNSNLTFDGDNGTGLQIELNMLRGPDYTDSSVTLNQWAAYSSAGRTPDQTTTWYTTNDATFEVTGVQLEVGSQATPFEHRSFGEELALCQRYYCHTYSYGVYPGANYTSESNARRGMLFNYRQNSTNYQAFQWSPPVEMRAVPTQTHYSMLGTAGKASGSTSDYTVSTNSPHNGPSGVMCYGDNTIANDGYVHFVLDAEL